MATSEILVFAEGPGANLETQAAYAADPLRATGNVAGIARSAINNKAIHQGTLMAAALAKFMADNQINNVVDTATVADLATWLGDALRGSLGVTPPQFDNDTSLATSAFVKRQGIQASGVVVVTATGPLAVAQAGGTVVGNAVGATTQTLPAASAFPAGARIEFMNINSGIMSVARAGTDTITTGSGAVNLLALGNGDTLTLESNGVSTWYAVDGSAQLPLAAVMSGPNWTTRPQFTNDTSLSTTAFLQRALGNMRGISGAAAIVANRALVAADAGYWFEVQANVIVDLPATSAGADGSTFHFSAVSDFTLRASAGETIYGISAAANTRTVKKGEVISVMHTSSAWRIVSDGFGAEMFASVLGTNGYQYLPGGLLIQTGKATTNASGIATITWPIPFPSVCENVVANASRIGVSALSVGPNAAYTTTGATFYADSALVTGFSYIAIGR